MPKSFFLTEDAHADLVAHGTPPDDIQRVARQYIKPDRLSIVLVGNAQGFVSQLRAVGFTDFEIIPIEQLDLMSATLKKEPPRRAAVTPDGSPRP